MTKNLTVGPPLRLIVLFTLPLLVGNLFQQLYAVTDAMVVGRMLGVDALAAVGASGSLQFLLFGFAMGASTGLAIPVARAFGAGDPAAVRRAVCAGILISAGIAVAITLIGTLGSTTLLTWMGTPPELMRSASTFLTVLFSGAVATVAFNFLSSVIRALGDSRTPLLFLVVACVLNAGLVVLLIAFFKLGVGGAAAATLVAQAISVALCLALITRRMPELKLRRRDWRFSPAELGESAKLGLTLGFQMSVIAIGAAILQYGINQLGTEAVAAFTAAMRVDQVAVIPLATVGMAISTYVAQNRGAGQWWRIRFGLFRAGVLTVLLALGLGGVITIFGTDLVRLFVGAGEDRVVAMAHQYLMLNGSLYWVLAILFLLRNALQGLGVTAIPTVAGFMELIARSAVGLLLIERIGFLGACLAAPLAWVAALVPVAIAWFVHRRRLMQAESIAASLIARDGLELAPQ
ncbi:MAG TPA: MATE family efflux transporter [Propionicimonas sp.]|jgi:putative MATE family efflux protein|uniref:MATE family efflux transporter n=1 Tax=Propionicimonas sp. TaxID=1955623 RepID=UPI002F420572